MTIQRYTDAYKAEGCTLTLVAPYTRLGGEGAKIGAFFGVAKGDVTSGDEGEFETEGVFNLTKTASQAWTQGDRIYWDNGNKRCDSDSAVGMFIGAAAEDAASGAGETTGVVKLAGAAPELLEGPQAAEAALTDNSGGATADGTIGAVTLWAALTDNGGGTADGTVSTMPDIALSTAGGNTYTDSAVNTAVNALALTIRNNMKEVTTTLATDRTAMVALTDAIKELSTKQNAVIAKLVLAGILD